VAGWLPRVLGRGAGIARPLQRGQLGAASQQRNGFGFTLGLGLLGGNARVEGRPAISLPLRVSDGAVFFGPLKVGEIPPLF
jgi:hypothetical protein